MSSLNLKKLAVVETKQLHLNDANDEPLHTDDGKPVIATVYSPGSKEFAAASARRDATLSESMKIKGSKVKTNFAAARTAREQFLADITVSIENISYDENLTGKELYLAIYKDKSIGFIADQIEQFVGDWSNFMKK